MQCMESEENKLQTNKNQSLTQPQSECLHFKRCILNPDGVVFGSDALLVFEGSGVDVLTMPLTVPPREDTYIVHTQHSQTSVLLGH